MMTIARWFKGNRTHEGTSETWSEPGEGTGLCLLLACENAPELYRLAEIVSQLFPERICDCGCVAARLVDFNNHHATTRDEIDKILHTYHLEYGA